MRSESSQALLCLVLLSGCREKSDRDLISELLDQTITAANEKRAGGIVEHASDDFVGPSKSDLRECRRILTGYFLQHGWLRVFEQSREITTEGDRANVKLDVVIAVGRDIKELEDLVPTNGSHLVFDVALTKKDGDWKYQSASYRHAN